MEISLIPTDHVVRVWGNVKGFLGKAAERTSGRYNEEDALHMVLEQGYNLWIAFDGDKIVGAVITCFVQYPRMQVLHIMFLGGEDGRTWSAPMLKTLQHWAFDTGCSAIEASGTEAWSRVLKDDGFKPLWHTFQLPIGATGLEA